MMLKSHGHLFVILILLLACNTSNQKSIALDEYSRIELKYAKAFSLFEYEGRYVIQSQIPGEKEGSLQQIQLFELNKDRNWDVVSLDRFPEKVAVISTTYLAYLEALDELGSVVGLANVDLVYSSYFKESSDRINIGSDHALNYEKLIQAKPDLVFFYDFGAGTSAVAKKMKGVGLNVIKVSEFREVTPLGKAEWIKFFGALFGKLDLAESIFSEIEQAYLEALKKKETFENKPSVFTGLPWKGEWYQPGGASFQAKYFEDAGANYLWSDNTDVSGINVDKEVVLDRALNADIWMHPSDVNSLKEIEDRDGRYAHFNSFKVKQVFNNNLRVNAHGGNDYWESGLLKPHVILLDLMAIFHPEQFPDHTFYYYKRIE